MDCSKNVISSKTNYVMIITRRLNKATINRKAVECQIAFKMIRSNDSYKNHNDRKN